MRGGPQSAAVHVQGGEEEKEEEEGGGRPFQGRDAMELRRGDPLACRGRRQRRRLPVAGRHGPDLPPAGASLRSGAEQVAGAIDTIYDTLAWFSTSYMTRV